ncbi:MAG: hexitol phosphatase HxpB [Bacteroidota bacterium]
MIKAVIFDMDGILIDSEPLWQQTEIALFGEFGIELTEEMLVNTRGLRSEEMVHYWCSRFKIDSVTQEELMNRYDDQMIETMRARVPLMEGAEEAIRFFREKKLPIALASCSTHAQIDAAMNRYGLKRNFGQVVSAANGMPGKPHPEVYLQTAAQMGIDPTFCLAIEDSFYGVIAAKAARMKVVAMPDPSERDQPRFGAADVKIRSLSEINETLFEKLQKI